MVLPIHTCLWKPQSQPQYLNHLLTPTRSTITVSTHHRLCRMADTLPALEYLRTGGSYPEGRSKKELLLLAFIGALWYSNAVGKAWPPKISIMEPITFEGFPQTIINFCLRQKDYKVEILSSLKSSLSMQDKTYVCATFVFLLMDEEIFIAPGRLTFGFLFANPHITRTRRQHVNQQTRNSRVGQDSSPNSSTEL